jgi:hypothetical protein
MSRPFAAYIEGGQLKLWDIPSAKAIPMLCACQEVMACDGRIYVKNGTDILELNFIESSFILASVAKVGNALDVPGATKVFDAVLIQSLLGSFFVSIFPAKGRCFQIKVKELEGHRIIDAKYENNMLAVVGVDKSGKYNRFMMRFSPTYDKYDCKIFKDVQYTGLNFTVADHGTCVLINEEEQVEIWSNVLGRGPVQVLDDPNIKGDMNLYHVSSKIVFAKGNELSNISMRKKP